MLDRRFVALAAALFVMSYASVAWTIAGQPLVGETASSKQAEVRYAALPTNPATANRKAQLAAIGGDGNPARDRLRLAAYHASTTYALTPCNEAARAWMIDAVSSYAQAWADMMDCGPNGCDYKKINATAAAFSTPLDIQVRDAIGAAFDQRGVSIEDFPARLQINVAMLVRGRGAPATACTETHGQAAQ
jgi:hypothetical protein